MNKNEWIEHRFGDIVLKSPAQFPVREIGNGTWYLLLKWTDTYSTEKIVVYCHRIKNEQSNALFQFSKQRIAKTGGLVLEPSSTNFYRFSAPSGYSNKDTTLPILKPTSDVDYSEYGVSALVGKNAICGVRLAKWHSQVTFQNWNHKEIFTLEEMKLVEEIAKTIRLANDGGQ